MKKTLTALCALAIGGMSLSACGSSEGADDGSITMGFAQVGAESGWRTANTTSIQESAKEAGYYVVTSKHRYSANSRAKIIGDTEGLVKVIAEKGPDGRAGTILGVHMVGPWVTEQLGQGYLAVNWEATVDEVAAFIQPHPTLSELFGDTIQDMTGRRLH